MAGIILQYFCWVVCCNCVKYLLVVIVCGTSGLMFVVCFQRCSRFNISNNLFLFLLLFFSFFSPFFFCCTLPETPRSHGIRASRTTLLWPRRRFRKGRRPPQHNPHTPHDPHVHYHDSREDDNDDVGRARLRAGARRRRLSPRIRRPALRAAPASRAASPRPWRVSWPWSWSQPGLPWLFS